MRKRFARNNDAHKDLAMSVLPDVRNLIENSVYIGSHYDYTYGTKPEAETDKRAIHYYVAAINTDEGTARVLLHVKTSQANANRTQDVSNKLYLERAEIIALPDGAAEGLDTETASRILPNSLGLNRATVISIPDLLANVNLNRMKFFDGPYRAEQSAESTPRKATAKPESLKKSAGTNASGAKTNAQNATQAEEPAVVKRGKVQRASKTASELYRAMGVKHTTRYQGKDVRSGRATGEYLTHSGVVVTKTHQDIATYAHELGHAIFERAGVFDGSGTPTSGYAQDIERMVGRLSKGFKDAYGNDTALLNHEALAEFTRLYLTDRNAAENFGGAEFLRRFKSDILGGGYTKKRSDALMHRRALQQA